ncbi:PREDICTED: scarecrow-like protein 28 [Tarenaya hassleriana]|uniref:scarecrow-like protein 28 n=1 Tax=Tarenaya hassleriana TaxID=28532 RepID=UPI00053CA1F3|nr:PREDICTED: scarecrow-like protein 28 [Tarenaya hassleriana]
MLAGCSSSTLLSPTQRLRAESPRTVQFHHHHQACHLPMNTQRLDLPCSSFSRKESSSNRSSQSNRPLTRSVSLDSKSKASSLKQHIKLPPLATTRGGEGFSWNKDKDNNDQGGKNLKRLADEADSCLNRAKRKRGEREGQQLGLGGSFWFEQFAGRNSPQVPFSLTCSGDEDRVCFVPSEVISQPLLSNPNWVDSVITELAGIGNKDTESSRPTTTVKEASGSSASSESHSLRYSLPESTNGSRNPYSHERVGARAGTSKEEDNNNNNHGNELQKDLELVGLLKGCLEAIDEKNIAPINHFIVRLGDLASPRGKTPLTRVTAYYTEGLALRITRMWPHIFHVTPPRDFERTDKEEDSGAAGLRFLNQVTPIPKFIHFTANEMLLRAFQGKERVHIIDFDIKQGLQWPSFFQSLAARPNPPLHVRITGIGESKQELNETGDRLYGFAEALNLPFEFHSVVDRLEDVRLWMLHVKEGESVAVNCVFQLHKTLYDTTGAAIRDFMGLIRSTNPIALVIAEQEAEHNTDHLETRICNSLRYYSAIFDSLHFNLPTDSLIRVKIEEMFGREIRNIVACEGNHRQERHTGFRRWRRLLEQLGFRSLGVSEREVLQSKMLLRMYGGGGGGFNVERRDEDGSGGVTLRWSDQELYTVSAWTPAEIGGSSLSLARHS